MQGLRKDHAQMQINARIVDHASSPDHSISKQIADMFETAQVRTVADLSNTQAVDACGYIGADAVSRLFQAALSNIESAGTPATERGDIVAGLANPATERIRNAWVDAPLPDYATVHCIRRGALVLDARASDEARVLEADDVNRLVRHYASLDTHLQASEEWWGGLFH